MVIMEYLLAVGLRDVFMRTIKLGPSAALDTIIRTVDKNKKSMWYFGKP